MAAKKKGFSGYVAQYTPGSYTFVAPKAGNYIFVAWGAGGGFSSGGGLAGTSGAYIEITRRLGVGQKVAIVCGRGQTTIAGQDSTVTFDNGLVVTAGGGGANNGTPGIASNGDVNLNGSAQATDGLGTGGGVHTGSNSGGAAPANLPFRGGAGSDTDALGGYAPGSGAGVAAFNLSGAPGMVIVMFVRP